MRPPPLTPLLLALMLMPAQIAAQEGSVPVPRPRPAEVAAPASPGADAPDSSAPSSLPLAPAASDDETSDPATPLPRPRPDPDAAAEGGAGGAAGDPSAFEPEPPRLYQTACPAALAGMVQARALPPIAEGTCGLRSPLAVEAVLVNGRMVPLATPATLGCGMATALPDWIAALDAYVGATENTGVAEVITGTSYMCRNVNNADAGDLSDHAFADALDVVGFVLEDGRRVTVEAGWSGEDAADQRLLRFAHDAACGRFTTVLGPEANALHRDHFHLDLRCHGQTCTARVCE